MLRPLSQTKYINDASLMGYWKLDEFSGNAADSSVNGNTLINNNSVTYVPALFANGADFEASSSQSLSIADGTQVGLQFTTAFTINSWVTFESLPGTNTDMQFVAKWATGSPQRSYRFGLQDSSGTKSLRLGVSSAGSSTVDASYNFTPSTGTAYLFSVTWNAGAYVFYINGAQVASGTTGGVTSLYNNTEPFYLGRSGDGAYFDGVQDDVSVFNRALSAGEIADIYQSATLGEYLGAGSGTTKLLLHLNGSSADSSGNGNNGIDTAITYSQDNGKFGQGAWFDGTTSYIDNRLSTSLNVTSVTASCWVKYNSTTGTIFVKKSSSLGGHQSYSLSAGTNIGSRVQLTSSSYSDIVTSGVTVNDGKWHNIILTFTSGSHKIYIDGVQRATGSPAPGGINYETNYIFLVGCSWNSGPEAFYNGAIDELIVEDRVWSPEKIKKYYTMTKGRFGII